MIEKCRIIYKGDMIAGSFYFFIGVILILFAGVLHYFTISQGFQYLSIGFFLFFFYCIGKGSFIFYKARIKYHYYLTMKNLSSEMINDERDYTSFRIEKKNVNRRRYIWSTAICSLIAVLGLFSDHKSIIMGTAIPITLISGIEFAIGLLTEFRLREFQRILNKNENT